MAAYVLGVSGDRLFDPAVGAGAFFRAARQLRPGVKLSGTEVAAEALDAGDRPVVALRDFVLDPPPGKQPAIVANPPYLRHHRLSLETKQRLRAFCLQFLGAPIDGRAGYHVYFLLRALERLAPHGRLAFIVPADTFEGVFAARLWRRLAERFRLDAVITFAPAAAPFPNVDTNAVIVLMANEEARNELRWVRWEQPSSPALRHWIESGFGSAVAGVEVLQRRLEEALATGLSRPPAAAGGGKYRLGDFCAVMRGIATGANEFFFMTAAQARERGLPMKFLRRAIGRTRDIAGEEVTVGDLDLLEEAGRPTWLLALGEHSLPGAVRAYLGTGERLGLPARALIASRNPWYKMEVRQLPPFLFAYLGRRSVRFIRNRAEVVPLTGFLCVYPRPEWSSPEGIEALWTVLRDPRTPANLALVGKSYGDGAIKVEPRALERLPLPESVIAGSGLDHTALRPQLRLPLSSAG